MLAAEAEEITHVLIGGEQLRVDVAPVEVDVLARAGAARLDSAGVRGCSCRPQPIIARCRLPARLTMRRPREHVTSVVSGRRHPLGPRRRPAQ